VVAVVGAVTAIFAANRMSGQVMTAGDSWR